MYKNDVFVIQIKKPVKKELFLMKNKNNVKRAINAMKNRYKQYIVQVMICALMVAIFQSHLYAADTFTQKVQAFITGTVLTWTRILGVIGILGGISGLAINRHNEEKLKGFWMVIAIGALIFAIPEIINLLFSAFAGGSINAFQ